MALNPRYRDGLLASATCAVIVGGSLVLGIDSGVFLDPVLAGFGVLCMVCTELTLLRVPELTRRIWGRPTVQFGSVVAVVLGSGIAVASSAAWVVAVLVWGLLAYLGLMGFVLVVGWNPLARLVK